ncbi:MAG: prepilin-type N-terminal cleavage/methylation domain-containing protein [Rubrivivax sp.]|nr:prepilin-type N-terminal cleavage/methylation domain-containing protein [Rubrivivax sp.]
MRQDILRAPRGISLIEALVAMAVMAFGMLGVVGMQATLRANADLSKQRTEAMRIAQERMEDLRNFSVLNTTAGSKAFQDKATFGATTVTGYTTNTTYTVNGAVTPTTPSTHKTLSINVAWTDRTGATQNVSLVSALANIAPELSASMVVSAQGAGGTREPEGRRRGIPPQAKNFGDGTSGFRPPQPTGTAVVWVFNNVTGLITSVCNTTAVDNATLTLAGLTGCVSSQAYQLISGYLRASTSLTQPTAADMSNPIPATSLAASTFVAEVSQTAPTTGTIACIHGRAVSYVEYYCAVPVTSPTPASWSGTLRINAASLPQLAPNLADAVDTNVKVCRYRADATYVGINVPVANQNLALIRSGNGATAFTCPTPPTYAHQPAA